MLRKRVEIYRKCLVKVQFLIGHAEDGTKNLKRVISTFLTSHVLGRPSLIDDDVVKAMLEQDPFPTTSEIAERLNSAQRTISDHIRKTGLVWKYSRWVPRELSRKNLDDRVIVCTSPLARNKIEPFWNRMITGDEKWITCNNKGKEKGILWTRKT